MKHIKLFGSIPNKKKNNKTTSFFLNTTFQFIQIGRVHFDPSCRFFVIEFCFFFVIFISPMK